MSVGQSTLPSSVSLPYSHCVFIDCENVCELDLSIIVGKPVRMILIVGHHQSKLPTSLCILAQKLREQIHIIQSPGGGRNALDFILAAELGKFAAANPQIHLHIISKDTGFDPLVKHLKDIGHRTSRYESINSVPALMTPIPDSRFDRLISDLTNSSKSRPKNRAGLEAVICHILGKSINSQQLAACIRSLIKNNILKISDDGKITYTVGAIKEPSRQQGAA